MSSIPEQGRRPIRSLFISDVHLGCKHSQAKELLEFLKQHQPKYLYIVGDFIDGWRLKRRWRWLTDYDALLHHLVALRQSGTRLFYTPGNHDSFLRGFLQSLCDVRLVSIRDQFIHRTADHRRFLVLHGDQFDGVEHHAQWLALLGCIVYDALLTLNRFINRLRGKATDPYAFSASVKRRVKWLVRHFSRFESRLASAARNHRCDGIICGHIHVPRIADLDNLIYCNTGDWVENCSALVEFDDGRLELIRYDGTLIGHVAPQQFPDEGGADPLPLETTDSLVDETASVA